MSYLTGQHIFVTNEVKEDRTILLEDSSVLELLEELCSNKCNISTKVVAT